jgi:predicted transcriptional regulator
MDTKALINPDAYTQASRTIAAKVDTETLRSLRELAVANDITVSRLINKAVTEYVKKHY